jgi:hypothetical protein
MFSRLAHAWRRRLARIPADTDPTPTISSVADYTVACGANVVITGTGFLGVSPRAGLGFVKSVHVGTSSASFTADSATQITAVAPDVPGDQQVVVNTTGGCATHATPLQIRPRIDTISPASVPDVGGVVVTLTGAGFTDATSLDIPAAGAGPHSFTVVDDATITFSAPPVLGGGTANVYITNVYQSDPVELVYTP